MDEPADNHQPKDLLEEHAKSLRAGERLHAVVERDEGGEPLRSIVITPPRPPTDPAHYAVDLYHNQAFYNEEQSGCTGPATEALHYAIGFYGARYPGLGLHSFSAVPPQTPQDQEDTPTP